MTKRLFIVLVVVAAMLVSFSFVLAAKNAPLRHTPDKYEKSIYANKHNAEELTRGTLAEKQNALDVATGRPDKLPAEPGVPVSGTLQSLGSKGGKDFCSLEGTAAWFMGYSVWGLEYYANYQDPAEFGCTAVWPFQPTNIYFEMYFDPTYPGGSFILTGYIFPDIGTPSCPEPDVTPDNYICSTLEYEFTLPAGEGYYSFGLPIEGECCIYQPYFAAVYMGTDVYGLLCRLVSEDGDATCRVYNDYGSGWDPVGAPGPLMLYTEGYTSPQNDCPAAGDSCYVTELAPNYITVLQGDAAVFTASVAFQGAQTECYLVADPDPVCPDCDVTVFNPNPVVDPGASSEITVQTAATTPVGVYTFQVNGYSGLKGTATVEVVAASLECEMARDNEAWTSFFGGWAVGDQQLVYFDPATMCVSCGAEPYPFELSTMKVILYDHSGTDPDMDYILHIYNSSGDPCDGPQEELISWPVSANLYWEWLEFDLPEVFCVNGPFFFALEFASDPGTGYLPCALWTSQTYTFDCVQWVKYQDAYVAWEDMWVTPKGFMSIRAVGTCVSSECPLTCNMQRDSGTAQGYASWIWEGFQAAEWYNPEDFCEAPVYPYNISDIELPIYKFTASADAVNLTFIIYLQCQDSCNGPGTEIYRSSVQAITGLPAGISMVHFDLDEDVCVYEPFYAAVLWESGPTPMPSLMMDNIDGIPYCHTWYYDPDYAEWYDHWDWWSTPATIGNLMLRVSGYTNHPSCAPPACDTVIQTLWGGESAAYYFKTPPNDEFINMKFEMPGDHSGRLETLQFGFYAAGTKGTPDPDFYVWLSDGEFPLDNNPPYQAIADFHIPFAEMLYWPTYTEIDAHSRNIIFDAGEMFHLGFSHAFEPGDTMAPLSDDGTLEIDRSSGWDGAAWEDYYHYQFTFNALICPFAPSEPTFTTKCRPAIGYATPGDPPVDVYTIELTAILGYSQNVTFSLLPITGITAGFTPNGAPCPYTTTVDITVDAAVPYGNYVLTFQAVGDDAQTKTCNVTLTVQPPFDEGLVHFYHGFQRSSNFGAVGNGDLSTKNFSWYGVTPLYDGSIISLAPIEPYEDHMALDLYDCEHVGFIPTQHMVITDDPWCQGSAYEQSYGEVAYSNFYTEEDVISCEYDSLFVIGLRDVECTDFSIKIKIYYNPTQTPIPQMYAGIYEDWDVGDDWAVLDEVHNTIYQYDIADPSIVFGVFSVPFYDQSCHNIVSVYNVQEVYPTGAHSVSCGVLDGPQYLAELMMAPGYRQPGFFGEGADDHSVLMTSPPFTLNPGERHIEIWVDFGRNLGDPLTWEQWYHKILRYVGFYRGDVNASDELELPALDVSDLVYLINYLYKGGPAPIPFADQGDVNGKGPYGGDPDVACPKNNVDVQDIVYLLNYIYKDGPPPVDRVRFIEQKWSRPSLFLNPVW